MRERIGLAIAIAASAVALIAGVAEAAPGDDAVIAANSFAVASHDGFGAGATCRSKSRALGGGVGTIEALVAGGTGVVSNPLDGTGLTANTTTGDVPRAWYAFVRGNELNSPPLGYKIFAICSQSSDATIVANTFSLGSGERINAGVTCPPGSRALSGGVGTTASNPNVNVYMSGPLDETGLTANTTTGDVARSWYAYVVSGMQADYKIFAICSPTSTATIAANTFSLDPYNRTRVSAACPSRSRALGGGVGTTESTPSSYIRLSSPLDGSGAPLSTITGDVARSWSASVFATSNRVDDKIFAICEKRSGGGGDKCKGKHGTIFASGARTLGTTGPDVIVGRNRKDKIIAKAGKDLVCARGGKDTVKGGPGKDKLFGEGGKDKLFGEGGKDKLFGQGGKDILKGGAAKDKLNGGAGKDKLNGGAGKDAEKQ